MKSGKELMLLSVLSVVFLAGCTSSSEGPSGTGVIITSFAPDVQEIDAGSSVTFTAVVKNVGGKSASDLKALIFGLSNEWTGSDLTTGAVKSSSSLASADPISGLPGEEESFDWTVAFPADKGKNADVTYDASVRIFYGYKTDADVLLRFVESSYLRTNPNVQKGVITADSSSGPLVITAAARTPSVGATAATGRVQFEIQNAGAGRVTDGVTATVSDAEPTTLDVIDKIEVTGAKSCAGKDDTTDGAPGDGKINLIDTRLAAGKSKVISCDVDVSGIGNFKDISLKLTASYTYFVDSATQVTVTRALE
jgi:hypothetical protein